MRKVAYTAAAVFSVLMLAIWSWRLSPLLPERGGAICFAAGYDPPLPVDLSSPRLDHRSVGEVSSMRLSFPFRRVNGLSATNDPAAATTGVTVCA
jgi:hypothetical protein